MQLITKATAAIVLFNIFLIPARASEDIEIFKQCLPETTKEIEVRAKYLSEETSYLYVGGLFPENNGEQYSTTLISIEDNTCEVLIAYNDFETKLFDILSFEVEKEIWIGNLEYAIERAGGKEQLQSLLYQLADSDITTERSLAEVMAMEELNLEVPPFYNLISKDPEIDLLFDLYQDSQLVSTPKFVNNIRIIDSFSIAEWYQKDGSNGLMLANHQDESWQVIGYTTQQDKEPSPEQLNMEFGVPLDIANQLLEAE